MASSHGDFSPKNRFIGVFSYGSNNEQQLRARVDNPRLSGRPAFLDGYVRVFGYKAVAWGGGSVASVAPKAGGRVYGRFYLMTPGEVAILDIYEHVKQGGYSKEVVMVNVRVPRDSGGDDDDDGHDDDGDHHHHHHHHHNGTKDNNAVVDVQSSAITYVMTYPAVQIFATPSPQYLTAVYRTVTSSFPELLGRAVEVCDHTGTKRSEWKHPGIRALPLEAFLLEVGLKEEVSWTFPTVLAPLVARLAAAGITTTDGLCEAATSGVLLAKLAAAPPPDDAAARATATAIVAANMAAKAEAEALAAAPATAAESADGDEQAEGPAGSAPASAASPSRADGSQEEERSRDETAMYADVVRKLQSRTTVPEFTERTVDIVARIVSGEYT